MKRLLAIAYALPVAAFLGGVIGAQEDSPELDTRGLVLHEEGAFEGYTLISPLTTYTVLLLDMEGKEVHRWEPGNTTESAILLENGNLLRWGIHSTDNERFYGPGVGGGLVEEHTWEGESVWRYVLDDDYQLLHHDIALLPNGNILYLAWEHRFQEDALEWGRDPSQIGEAGMWPDAVFELRRTPPEGGEIVWEWHSWDHIVQDHDAAKENHGSVIEEVGRIDMNFDHRGRAPMTPEELEAEEELARQMAALGYGGEVEEAAARQPGLGTVPDWLHTNAIDYLPEHDLIVLSSPNLNELLVLDHSTTSVQAAGKRGGRFGRGGEILWRWGNPKNHGAGEGINQQLSFQHDPTWLPTDDPNELRLLVFNNGQVRPGAEPFSSVDELVLPFHPEHGFLREAGTAYGPAEPDWTYSDPGTFYSSFISGAQRLPNGNTLICSGVQGRVFEVTRRGEVVWDFRNSYTGDKLDDMDGDPVPANSLYRAVRIASDHPGLADRGL